ncbi:hypothetical protein HK096_008533, partial [Nowakowskiella sp. JEL0078]
PEDLRFVLSKVPTKASVSFFKTPDSQTKSREELFAEADALDSSIPHFPTIISSNKITISTQEGDEVIQALQDFQNRLKTANIGDVVELSMEVFTVAKEISRRIELDGGAALIVDYGDEEIKGDTLRAIKGHVLGKNPLIQPGEWDLSADVDFRMIKYGASNEFVRVNGPITQEWFLTQLGINARLEVLMNAVRSSTKISESEKEHQLVELKSGFSRLIEGSGKSTEESVPGHTGMGNLYKVVAITRASDPTPYSFGDNQFIDEEEYERTKVEKEKEAAIKTLEMKREKELKREEKNKLAKEFYKKMYDEEEEREKEKREKENEKGK